MGTGNVFARVMGIFLLAGGVIAVGLFVFFERNGEARSVSTEDSTHSAPVSVSAFITPHHLVAKASMHNIFQTVSKKIGGNSIDRIILLSPNHFDIGRSWMIGSEKSWKTPFGMLDADIDALRKLQDVAFISQDIFEREHGVRNIFPFIKEYFPRAMVIPLALRDEFPEKKADDFIERLKTISSQNTLLIVSADFSHYLDWNFSRFHDAKSLEVLRDLDISHVDSLDTDCVACLRIAMKYSEFRGASNFQLLSRTSSLEMLGMNVVGSETSHITGYFSSESPRGENYISSTRILFSGKVSPNRMTEGARRVFMSQDKNIFEEGGKMKMNTFSQAIDDEMIDTDPVITARQLFSVQTIDKRRIAFVDADMSSDSGWNFENIVQGIVEARQKSDTVVALWSKNTSLQKEDSEIDNNSARKFIDAGADVVIGKSSQTIKSVEIYKNKFIIPSLGDISFDCQKSRNSCFGMLVAIGFSSVKTEYVFMPVVMEKSGKIILATGDARDALLEILSDDMADESLRSGIRKGILDIASNVSLDE